MKVYAKRKIDKTFGDSLATNHLGKILEEYPEHSKAVCRILGEYFQRLSYVMFIPDISTRKATLSWWRQLFIDRVKQKGFPEIIENHILSIGATKYRQLLRGTKEKEVK